jgi:hypothetical protein
MSPSMPSLPRSGIHLLRALVVSLLVAALAPPARAAIPPPPTLFGQEMVSHGGRLDPTETLTVDAQCEPNGVSFITYSASGPTPNFPYVLIVPYPGTFSESGRVVIGPQAGPPDENGFPSGAILSWHVEFEIVSGDTRITGFKDLDRRSIVLAWCRDLENEDLPGVSLVNGTGPYYRVRFDDSGEPLNYWAFIDAPQGRFADNGTWTGELNWVRVTGTRLVDGAQTTYLATRSDENLLSRRHRTRPLK